MARVPEDIPLSSAVLIPDAPSFQASGAHLNALICMKITGRASFSVERGADGEAQRHQVRFPVFKEALSTSAPSVLVLAASDRHPSIPVRRIREITQGPAMRRRERVKPSSSRHHQPLRTAKTFRSVSYIISYAPSTDATCKVCKQAFHAGKLRWVQGDPHAENRTRIT